MPDDAAHRKKLWDMAQRGGMHWGHQTTEYHERANQIVDDQWAKTIGMVLGRFPVDYTRSIDFAAGFGRHTEKLLQAGEKSAMCIDLNLNYIAALEGRYADRKDAVSVVQNEGVSLAGTVVLPEITVA